MKKQLTKELMIYSGLCVLFIVLSLTANRLFVFGAVIFGIMAISCAGGALFSQKPQSTPTEQDGLSPFGLNINDVAPQLDALQKDFEQGIIDEATYYARKEQIMSQINKF